VVGRSDGGGGAGVDGGSVDSREVGDERIGEGSVGHGHRRRRVKVGSLGMMRGRSGLVEGDGSRESS